jgi:hypothetical protein
MILSFLIGYTDGYQGIAEGQQLTRLHSYPMHPCQLFFLALCAHPTRKFDVLLGHELLALNDLARRQPNGGCGSKGNEDGFVG